MPSGPQPQTRSSLGLDDCAGFIFVSTGLRGASDREHAGVRASARIEIPATHRYRAHEPRAIVDESVQPSMVRAGPPGRHPPPFPRPLPAADPAITGRVEQQYRLAQG
ncbi:hypothetical protein N7455_006082 [Penicillium solitum]|uniref:uncharacterized protein n=1 Tax=Penicillium solitum TaxID=60172 RepID=UPI0032C47744|nr:hypothetical protein N7455_006082 [Penicillium solitum]